MRVEVSNTKALARVLDGMNTDYEILTDTEANIYGEVRLSALVLALDREGCELISSHEQDENLETYFINLIGGGENA